MQMAVEELAWRMEKAGELHAVLYCKVLSILPMLNGVLASESPAEPSLATRSEAESLAAQVSQTDIPEKKS